MSLLDSTLLLMTFKHLQGKSMTDINKGVGNEAEGIKLNIDASSIFINDIDSDPNTAVFLGIAEFVSADLELDPTSNNQAYFAKYPIGHPKAGQRVINAIPPIYGAGYEAKPFIGVNPISVNDPINWVYQYQSGIFYLQNPNLLTGTPTKINLYVYIGDFLTDLITGNGIGSNGNIPVNATGVDNYIGSVVTGYGPITSYDQNVIYLVSFANNNTGPSTLNIDGIGALNILKGDPGVGLTPLQANDIQANIVYYLVYDGAQFQIFDTDPTSSPGKYKNLNPTTINVGGVTAGTTFNNVTYNDVFDLLFYPYLQPVFDLFKISGQAAVLEVGDTVTGGSRTFVWNTTIPTKVVANTIKISDITNNVILIVGLSNTGSKSILIPSITNTTATTHTWRIYGTRTNNTVFTKDFTVAWRWRVYCGTSTNMSLTENEIKSLANNTLAVNFNGTFQFTSGGYKYYCIPDVFEHPSLFIDFSTNLSVAMAGPDEGYTITNGNGIYYQLVSVTNTFGVTQNYRVYRSKYQLGGSIQIIVI